jgi:hypothetical protein
MTAAQQILAATDFSDNAGAHDPRDKLNERQIAPGRCS